MLREFQRPFKGASFASEASNVSGRRKRNILLSENMNCISECCIACNIYLLYSVIEFLVKNRQLGENAKGEHRSLNLIRAQFSRPPVTANLPAKRIDATHPKTRAGTHHEEVCAGIAGSVPGGRDLLIWQQALPLESPQQAAGFAHT